MSTPVPTTFKYISPVLSSADVDRDLRWYADKTGFTSVFQSTNEHGKTDYAVIGRQHLYIHLQWHANTSEDPVYGGVVRIGVVNIRPLFEELVERGAVEADRFREGTAWGTNEFGFYDLNGNALFFYEDI